MFFCHRVDGSGHVSWDDVQKCEPALLSFFLTVLRPDLIGGKTRMSLTLRLLPRVQVLVVAVECNTKKFGRVWMAMFETV